MEQNRMMVTTACCSSFIYDLPNGRITAFRKLNCESTHTIVITKPADSFHLINLNETWVKLWVRPPPPFRNERRKKKKKKRKRGGHGTGSPKEVQAPSLLGSAAQHRRGRCDVYNYRGPRLPRLLLQKPYSPQEFENKDKNTYDVISSIVSRYIITDSAATCLNTSKTVESSFWFPTFPGFRAGKVGSQDRGWMFSHCGQLSGASFVCLPSQSGVVFCIPLPTQISLGASETGDCCLPRRKID
ncbi:hypothetical protein CEXT_288761 [Caerostris extrusa]|uniref:Uncharacterized protein n=1 Tax=Caerostris extrusa TaxID=172846 RepID=A0AAV4RPS9_CAEEX|nr:hypothetical protein CEXT_288761 [Caerostris extrusa]